MEKYEAEKKGTGRAGKRKKNEPLDARRHLMVSRLDGGAAQSSSRPFSHSSRRTAAAATRLFTLSGVPGS